MNEEKFISPPYSTLVCTWSENTSGKQDATLQYQQSAELPFELNVRNLEHIVNRKSALSDEELRSVINHKRLNDFVLSEYFKLLRSLPGKWFSFDPLVYHGIAPKSLSHLSACFKLSEYKYEKTARVTGLKKQVNQGIDLLKALRDPTDPEPPTMLLMPSNNSGEQFFELRVTVEGGHWLLAVADLHRREWWLFDSCGEDGFDEAVIDDWEGFLKDHWNAVNRATEDDTEFPPFFRPQLHHPEELAKVPQQRKGTHNCGPFVCMFARVLVAFVCVEVDVSNIIEKFLGCEGVSLFRKLMFLELIDNKLCEAREIVI